MIPSFCIYKMDLFITYVPCKKLKSWVDIFSISWLKELKILDKKRHLDCLHLSKNLRKYILIQEYFSCLVKIYFLNYGTF